LEVEAILGVAGGRKEAGPGAEKPSEKILNLILGKREETRQLHPGKTFRRLDMIHISWMGGARKGEDKQQRLVKES